ncbi:hypothetical protein LR48_Vigan11g034200 [Vigna angularis]|uniref:Glycosyl transferase CAP10 domain-containing protein n=1 Tax=Phaseolus angularis TaxID=3914 RepID=A0A0L9VRC4_PHAAN|nr:hypothetical protein LR48_Vigan11g034200 [Vigna angularis]
MIKWIFFSIIILIVFVASSFFLEADFSRITSTTLLKTIIIFNNKPQLQFPLNCTDKNSTATCSSYYPTTLEFDGDSTTSCPDYFRWIHEDLKPWKSTGITRDMVERGRNVSHFRLVIVNGKVYVQKLGRVYQTRDVFTIWGVLQLLRLYPGKIPDLDLMFQCGDKTVILKKNFQGPQALSPPPVFHYCGDEISHDIVFPDWSFWGWPEINIGPWERTLHNILEGNKKTKWIDRVPYAFWKGNPAVANIRRELMKCNPTKQQDWNARIESIQWNREKASNYANAKLENQCTHRYKIYIEGAAWSAQMIGNGGTDYILENLKMKYVYDYMFHLLNDYAKLLKFKPTIPEGAIEICSESMACPVQGLQKSFMEESMVNSPSDTLPCVMPSPHTPQTLKQFLQEKENLIEQVKKKGVNSMLV